MKKTSGFTLVELLISILGLAVIVLILGGVAALGKFLIDYLF